MNEQLSPFSPNVQDIPSQRNEQSPPVSLSVQDVLYILFRHKWKIIVSALIGLGAAAAYYFLTPPVYESEAKMLVRYVVERSAIDSLDQRSSDNIINAEIEILTSWDLAGEVVDALGIERFVDELPESAEAASRTAVIQGVIKGLTATPGTASNVIYVSYRNSDPKLANAVLQKLLERYFEKHLQVHRSMGAFDFVSKRTDQMRGRLLQTEDELKKLKKDAGILSLADSTVNINTSLAKCNDELLDAEAALAEQKARVGAFDKLLTSDDKPRLAKENSEALSERIDSGAIQRYQTVMEWLAQLQSKELELLGRYAESNPLVVSTRNQIARIDRQRRELEERFPGLLVAVPKGGQDAQRFIVNEQAQLAALIAKVETLRAQLSELREARRPHCRGGNKDRAAGTAKGIGTGEVEIF